MNKQVHNKGSSSKDIILKTFWRDNEHFADLFNAALFNGSQIIKPDQLVDSDTSAIIKSDDYNESIKRNRDVVKKMFDGVEFTILGLEIQDKTHFAMPLRTMTYDTLGYIKEYNNIKKQHKLNNDSLPSSESFLSGITADDRFHPIITLVLYYGETLWTGPLNLSDMMVDMSSYMKSLFSDYHLNLIQILDSDKYTFYNDDVRNLFNITKNIYKEDIEAIYSQYQSDNVDPEVIELISVITDTPQLLELCSNHKNGGNTMCNAFRNLEAQWTERGKQEGRQEGIACEKINSIITMLELGITKEQILTKYSLEEFNKAEESLLQNRVSQ
jgi:hypothetical protein